MKMMFLAAVACLGLTGRAVHPSAKCETPPPLCEAAARADVVFFGEVLHETTYVEYEKAGPRAQGIQAVQFNVIRAFKGAKPAQWWGLFYFNADAKQFQHGARYLVFGQRSATGAFHHGCTLTQEMEKAGDEEVWLRTGAVELAACFKTRH